MFNTVFSPSLGPKPLSWFSCNGTLIREATGFDSCLARSASAAHAGLPATRNAVAERQVILLIIRFLVVASESPPSGGATYDPNCFTVIPLFQNEIGRSSEHDWPTLAFLKQPGACPDFGPRGIGKELLCPPLCRGRI
ncbi:MAG TPA: hypothetical protein VNQ78_13550 [Paracoccus sp. (in: a-proteobacteria)]|uniref:hypothetical protein n=1 Tax=Paracoccus sp. TaxID=267 RepID=UPI002CC471D7|nr:hypothetical protein [Paracoccus sp. (in: a-proteobacteria)]HWL57681.1 hypothetical protein [Paracoccus sp. (in: a-proteobacteria)]